MNNMVASLALLLVATYTQAHNSEEHTLSSPSDTVLVFKYDQSLQCGQAGVETTKDQQQLENSGIAVQCSFKAHDGMMRPQACGRPTGNINVFEIPAEGLATALETGFKSVASLQRFSGNECGKDKRLSPNGTTQPKPRPLPGQTKL